MALALLRLEAEKITEGEGFEPSMDGNPPITVFETAAALEKPLLIGG
jgi:hypothetical protein